MPDQINTKNRIFSEALEARLLLTDLAWSNYLGGIGSDWGTGIVTDSADNVYISGFTDSLGWISGGYDSIFGTDDTATEYRDAFVVKLNSSGEHLWSTYIGGSKDEIAGKIAVNAAGDVFIAGTTTSSGWIGAGLDNSYNGGGSDGFVVKLNSSGDRVWSTYLGGSKGDYATSIAIDPNGNVCVAGRTRSSGWISGGFDTSYNGGSDIGDGFVVKLNANGERVWSTYLGGTRDDAANDIATDSSGNIFVAGDTNSENWMSGGFDTNFNSYGFETDGFVIKVNSSGQQVWSSYLGGGSTDTASGVVSDNQGNIYVTGATQEMDWISGGYDEEYSDYDDAYVVKMNSTGAHVWSTYLGGDDEDNGYGIAIDQSGNLYVTGETDEPDWLSGGLEVDDNFVDAFVVKLTSEGEHIWSSLVGRTHSTYGYDIAIDNSGGIFVGGYELEHYTQIIGNSVNEVDRYDGFVTKITESSLSSAPFIIAGLSTDGNGNQWLASGDDVSVGISNNVIVASVNRSISQRPLGSVSSIKITTGSGNDTITIADDVMGVTIDAGDGNDRIIGSDNSDSIRGGAGNDYIVANEGNDTVYGGSGKDTLTGSAGKDKLYGENDEDRINGGKGNDTIFGGSGDDRMYGNEDNDYIDGGGNIDRAWGGTGNDTLIGGGSNDKLYGEGGNDRFFGNAGADLISGGSGTDAAKDEDDGNLYLSIESYF